MAEEQEVAGFDMSGMEFYTPETDTPSPTVDEQTIEAFSTPSEEKPSPLSRRPGFRGKSAFDFSGFGDFLKDNVSKEEIKAGLDNAGQWMVPFYESGSNMVNVVNEYMKPEEERDYDYIKDELGKAGESAAVEGAMWLLGGVATKYGGKGIKYLYNKVKQYEIDPNVTSAFGVGAIKKKEALPLEIGVNTFLEDGKFLKNYDADTAATMAEKAKNANAGNKRANALINAEVPEGTKVGVRLNLNSTIPDSPKGLDKLQTLHKGSFSGTAMSYLPFATVRNVSFNVSQKGRTAIASRIKGIDTPEAKAKYPAMSVDGDYVPNKNLLDEGGDLVEIGLNPANHHLFIDLKTGQAVKGAEEATVIGDRVYARGVEYWKKAEAPDPLPTQSGEDILSDVRYKFNQGGKVMNMQNQMSLFEYGGIADDGMKRDPVSGNAIPPGSMASEVRDDIPAMLSEGEYVVPADVLRYYGVNFFEDLRNKAKSGLQNMEQNGRIGGEPLSPQQIQQNMGQAPVPMQANQGALVGYQDGGLEQYQQLSQSLGGQSFDPSKWSTVGGSTFTQQQSQDSVTTFKTFVNAQTGEKQVIEFVDGKLKNQSMEEYTVPPYYEFGSSALKKAQQTAQQQTSSDDGGNAPTTPTEPSKGFGDWGSEVDWSDPLAYAESLVNGKGSKLGKIGLTTAALVGGPAAMAGIGAFQTATGLTTISDLRAASIIAKAQGMDEQSKKIDGMVSDILGKSSNAVNFLDDLVATGTKKATSALDRLGMKYTRDKETGKITFTANDITQNKARDTDPNDGVYKPGGIDVALGRPEGEDSGDAFDAAVAASRAKSAQNKAAMEKAQKATGGTEDIKALKEAYIEAGGEWATTGRAKGGLMTKKKK